MADRFIDSISGKLWDWLTQNISPDNILDNKNINIKGLSGSLRTLFLHILLSRTDHPVLAVLPSREDAESLFDEICELDSRAVYFPGGEEETDSPVIVNPRRAGLQMEALRDILTGRAKLLVTSGSGIKCALPSPEVLHGALIHIEPGKHFEMTDLVEKLITYGYNRESMVEKPGEISLRGGILDIYPYTGEAPHRVEFFGDQIDSMRTFDLATQKSRVQGTRLDLMPSPVAWKEKTRSLLDYFTDDSLIVLQDPERITDEEKSAHSRSKELSPRFTGLLDRLKAAAHLVIFSFSGSPDTMDLGAKECRPLGTTTAEIRESLASLADTHSRVFLLCEREDHKRRINDFLGLDELPISRLSVEVSPLRSGFLLPGWGLAVYTEEDILGRKPRRRLRKRFQESVPIRELSALKKGDTVVHIDHGIGRYLGLEKITVRGETRECLTLGYRDGDRLYVSLDKMERVQRYAGREGAQPVMSKLGGDSWEKVKLRTKRSIKNIARDLISLYSARQALPGYAFSPDTPWQRELETGFLYEETLDQAKAIQDVKRDMQLSRPMDRLICGDVGFGKTEVAVRAAFKAVNDGKQVAVLVPTTILAQQHFRTFQERLSRYPVRVEMLSRFRSRKEQKQVVEALKQGLADIVIGTHRLISRDIGFRDLGLLIIDEEQRFGVRHKEKLKDLRKTVDVLALSATPIPRTLHLSMMGIRDMSLINTAPKDRLPIITEVAPFSEDIVVHAIDRELARNGQVFFVHNRIQSIYAVARMIRRLIPGIRLAVAHGRMETEELERVMLEFIDKKYDCLVSTMIIESGLDMPNVNTLIVHRADRLGLAQLYQIRGRVGRSDARAYAYLLTPPFQNLTQEAVKRLRTIEEFTELGSGIQIALRDLEIRGAGNLLGVEQSGYMDAVGFELYTRLVEEAVDEVKAEEAGLSPVTHPRVICQVDVHFPAFLPDTYVYDEGIRVNLYRRISQIQEMEELDSMEAELRDRFGALPEEAKRLLDVKCLQILAQSRGIKRISLGHPALTLLFDDQWIQNFPTPELFSRHLRSISDSVPAPIKFIQKKDFGLRVDISDHDTVGFAKKVLQSWS